LHLCRMNCSQLKAHKQGYRSIPLPTRFTYFTITRARTMPFKVTVLKCVRCCPPPYPVRSSHRRTRASTRLSRGAVAVGGDAGGGALRQTPRTALSMLKHRT
jgi:hypothetical protein